MLHVFYQYILEEGPHLEQQHFRPRILFEFPGTYIVFKLGEKSAGGLGFGV